jgi:UDP-glucose 4-epimerase
VKGDIQSMDLLTFVLSAEKVDTIMHFAAQASRAWGRRGAWAVS